MPRKKRQTTKTTKAVEAPVTASDVKKARREASEKPPALNPTRFNQLFDAHIASRLADQKVEAHVHEPTPEYVDAQVSAYTSAAEVGQNIPDQQAAESDRRDADFLTRYLERTSESKAKAAFIEFFDLAAKLNESAHGLGIRGATLDADSGEVTVTFKTRAAPEPRAT